MYPKSIRVLSVALFIAGSLASVELAVAKKPIDTWQFFPLVSATFQDDVTDSLQSDGLGAYENAATCILSDFIVRIDTGKRTAFLDLAEIVSGPATTPFEPETSGDVELAVEFWPIPETLDEEPSLIGWVSDMEPGQVYPVVVEIREVTVDRQTWFITSGGEKAYPATAQAFDDDGDGIVDIWVITVPEETLFSASISQKGNKASIRLDTKYSIPFTATVTLR